MEAVILFGDPRLAQTFNQHLSIFHKTFRDFEIKDLVAVVNNGLLNSLRGLVGNYTDTELANHLSLRTQFECKTICYNNALVKTLSYTKQTTNIILRPVVFYFLIEIFNLSRLNSF